MFGWTIGHRPQPAIALDLGHGDDALGLKAKGVKQRLGLAKDRLKLLILGNLGVDQGLAVDLRLRPDKTM